MVWFPRSDSMSGILIQLSLPSFDTIIHNSRILFETKGKEKYLYSTFLAKVVHSKHSGMAHTVLPANNTMPAFPSWAFTRCHELQTFRTQDLSFPRTNGPYGELGTFVPGTFRSRELSFSGTKVPRNFRSRALSFSGTFFPENESSWELSFLGPFIPGELSFPLSDRPRRAALLCVLNYCMFGCALTLMMLTPLWTSQLTLYVGRPAFAARLSVFNVPITVSLRRKRLT